MAARAAIANPLLDDVAIRGARGVLINIVGGKDLTLYEIDEAAELIRNEVDEGANIIVGSTLDTSLDGVVRVSVVATGIDTAQESTTARDSKPASPEVTAKIPPLIHTRKTAAESEPVAAAASEAPETLDAAEPPLADEQAFAADHEVPEEPVEAVQAQKPARPGRFGLGFLGIRRKPSGPPPAIIADGEPKMSHRSPVHGHARAEPQDPVSTEPEPVTDDLFGGHIDEKLEIPAFLRRQAN